MQTPPAGKKEVLQVVLDPPQARWVRAVAANSGMAVSTVIRMIVEAARNGGAAPVMITQARRQPAIEPTKRGNPS
jgi:antitoxin component of RelBE/YafQ-DinJ toxin-antitoxin module